MKRITDRGHSLADVADRLGVSIHSLYAWQKQLEKPTATRQADTDQTAELRRVKSELRRVTEERDILKNEASKCLQKPGRFIQIASPQACPDAHAHWKL